MKKVAGHAKKGFERVLAESTQLKRADMIYKNRLDAGQRLARELAEYRSQDPVILALPRGGVEVAAPIAEALDAPLDLVLVRKIGVPMQPELAMGAIVDGAEPYLIPNENVLSSVDVSAGEFEKICERELKEIERRRRLYLEGRPRAEVRGRIVIIADDGIATGSTVRAAIQAVRKRSPKELILAVPVASASTLQALSSEVDKIICLQCHEPFYAIGLYYQDFHQVTDEEVVEILSTARVPEGHS
jgi:putative phosphoribosyl transferase